MSPRAPVEAAEVLAWRERLAKTMLEVPRSVVLTAWQSACQLKALRVPDLVVEGLGAKVTVTLRARRAVLDFEAPTWWADGRPVRWRTGCLREEQTFADVVAWLVDGVEPPKWEE